MILKPLSEITKYGREKGKPSSTPYIEIGDIDIDTKEYSYKDKPSLSGCLIAKKGNILISRVRPTRGAVSIVKEDNVYVSSAFTVLEPNRDILLSDYLFYSLAYNKSLYRYLEKMQKGTSYPSCKEKDILSFRIPIPSIFEQKRIAKILKEADALRKKRQKSDELSSKIIAAIFCRMFNNSLRGKNPGEIMLGEVIQIKRSLVNPAKEEFQHLPHINGEVIESKTGSLLKYNTVAEEKLISGKFLFENEDVLYNKIRPYLCKATMPRFRGLCSADMYPITPDTNHIIQEYLLWLLLSDKFTHYTVQCSTRARMPKLNREELFAFRTVLPPLSEQKKFADLAQKVEKMKEKQQESKKDLDYLFYSLMEKEFLGA